ncbi:MAG TPA: DUF2442 domain-containing protein [Rhodocyclaceae bacterium]
MNRDQFECKFKQYRVLHEAAAGGAVGEPARARGGPRCHSPQVIALGRRGFSVLVDGLPLFVAFQDHPAFASASADDLRQVQRPYPNRLFWPKLDIRLSIDALRSLERRGPASADGWSAALPA